MQVAAGFLFYVRDGQLLAHRFDEEGLSVIGPAIPLAGNVEFDPGHDFGVFSVSGDVIVYREQMAERERQFAWFDRKGEQLGSAGEPFASLGAASVSRDLSQVAFTLPEPSGTGRDVWVMDLNAGRLRGRREAQISVSGGRGPVCSTDGNGVTFLAPEGLLFVPIRLDDELKIGDAETLIAADELAEVPLTWPPLAFDGERFLSLKFTSEPPFPEPLRLVKNWKQLLDDL